MYWSYDVYRFMFGAEPPERRLAILREESTRALATISGYNSLMARGLDLILTDDTRPLFQQYGAQTLRAVQDVQDLVFALTWAPRDYGRADLRAFASLWAALMATAEVEAPTLAGALTSPQLGKTNEYPLRVTHQPDQQRQIELTLHPRGFALEIQQTSAAAGVRWDAAQFAVPSLAAVVRYSEAWLVAGAPWEALPAHDPELSQETAA